MTDFRIRRLDAATMSNLKTRAEKHGCSIEEEVRHILEVALQEDANSARTHDRLKRERKGSKKRQEL